MERKPLSFPLDITVTGATQAEPGGSGSADTPSLSAIADAGGYLRQIIVKAPQPTAQFNFRIENSSEHNILKRTEIVGELIEELATPMPKDTYSCFIERSSHNGNFEVELIYCEVY